MLWQTEKQQKAAARKAVREKEKITQALLISERGWTKGPHQRIVRRTRCFCG